MKTHKTENLHLLVALDLSKMDKILIDYINFIDTKWGVEKVDFLHNIKQTELLNIYEEIADDTVDLEKLITKELKKVVGDRISQTVSYEVIVKSENYTEGMLSRWAETNKVDYMILGKKSELRGTGGMAQKLIRLSKANMILVPEEISHQLEKVVIPTDFTANSSKAFKKALALQNKPGFRLEALHIFNIPSVYFPYIDRETAIDKAESHLRKRYKSFAKKHKLGNMDFHLVYRENKSIVESISRYIKSNQIDMCVMSARGGNKITSLLIGSITNEILMEDIQVPILIVK